MSKFIVYFICLFQWVYSPGLNSIPQSKCVSKSFLYKNWNNYIWKITCVWNMLLQHGNVFSSWGLNCSARADLVWSFLNHKWWFITLLAVPSLYKHLKNVFGMFGWVLNLPRMYKTIWNLAFWKDRNLKPKYIKVNFHIIELLQYRFQLSPKDPRFEESLEVHRRVALTYVYILVCTHLSFPWFLWWTVITLVSSCDAETPCEGVKYFLRNSIQHKDNRRLKWRRQLLYRVAIPSEVFQSWEQHLYWSEGTEPKQVYENALQNVFNSSWHYSISSKRTQWRAVWQWYVFCKYKLNECSDLPLMFTELRISL